MNYRHAYHAGNFSDVMKHWVLTLILKKLQEKETPFGVLDAYAGVGLYNLKGREAMRTKEWTYGIRTFLENVKDRTLFEDYLQVVESYLTPQKSLYPGSPLIARAMMRPQDRLRLSELHPDDAESLRLVFEGDRQTKVLHQEALISLKAMLPFPEKRGLVLIDPPFERTDEFQHIAQMMGEAQVRFAHGIYMIWYPIKDYKPLNSFYKLMGDIPFDKRLVVEFMINATPQVDQLNGCGLYIVNAPWQLDDVLRAGLPKLMRAMGYLHGKVAVKTV